MSEEIGVWEKTPFWLRLLFYPRYRIRMIVYGDHRDEMIFRHNRDWDWFYSNEMRPL